MKETAILLTGAGFTHNFGTPLANGMWSEIFNSEEIQNHQSLREIMLSESFKFDYENIYNHVLNTDSFTHIEKEAMIKATVNAYENLDEIVIGYKGAQDLQYQISFTHVKEFIVEFAKHGGHHLFTLNQDLFFERKFINEARSDKIELSIPGIDNYLWFDRRFSDIKRNFKLPDETKLELNKKTYSSNKGFYYIKLHGSQNWESSTSDKGMVIGTKKEVQIINEPLLNWYFEIFQEVLYKNNNKLLVIGYGFSDKHINKVIKEAILEFELKLYIFMPLSPDELKLKLCELNQPNDSCGDIIWNGIHGFFPYELSQVFPANQTIVQPCRELYKHLFNIGLRR